VAAVIRQTCGRAPKLISLELNCHCEERTDEAISTGARTVHEIASLRSQ
jgi:hypothetical protein